MHKTRFFEQQDGSKIGYKVLEPKHTKNDIPLVLIMGLGATKEHFLGFEEVITFDNRGIGESTVASYESPITIELMAQDTIELIRHLGIKRFNLYGASMGGNIALCVALNVPSDLKLEKLIIGSGFARFKTDTKSYEIAEQIYNLPKMEYPKTIHEQKAMLLTSEKDLTDYLLEHPDKFDKIAEIMLKTNANQRQWEAIKQSDLISRLQEIKVPTLIIHGEVDEIVPIDAAELLNREIPNTKFHRIPKVGHSIYIVECDFVSIVNEFLNN
ncbi:866_t:CDS:2 [Cetraspora pellucida]|uniref:866_t:CDS:1 n=1 Tax=Cetraspora pellucida TaxID=1433469 RepID=A0A9N8Z1Y7_9GLOM|nr:866_t:CDS:2 [Cetraspora pellucida]